MVWWRSVKFLNERKKKKARSLFSEGVELYHANQFDLAQARFKEAEKLFKSINETTNALRSLGYYYLCEGMKYKRENKLLESSKAFGKANANFSKSIKGSIGTTSSDALDSESEQAQEEAKLARKEQAKIQEMLAMKRAREGNFLESARLYESAAALYESIGLTREAARARARSYVQRAAAVDSAFEKADFLERASSEFRKGREPRPIIQAHAYYFRGLSMMKIKPKAAVDYLQRAYEIYEREGIEERRKKVKEKLQELLKLRKERPSEFGL